MTYAARHGRSAASPSAADAQAQELVDAAQAWVDDDPDHETRVELGDLLAKAKTGDQDSLDDLADRFSGILEFGTAGLRGAIGAGPNRMNRSVVIRAQVNNSDARLRPGMFARIRLVTRDLQDSMVVPEQAIVPEGDEQYVFRVLDNKAVRTKVETGQRRDAKVEIVKGLSNDDMVVTAGQIKLRDGSPVAVANAATLVRDAKDDSGVSGKPGAAVPSPRS